MLRAVNLGIPCVIVVVVPLGIACAAGVVVNATGWGASMASV